MPQPFDCLLPVPRRCDLVSGPPIRLRRFLPEIRVQDDRLLRSCQCLNDAFTCGRDDPTAQGLPLTIEVEPSGLRPHDGYRLELGPDRAVLVGRAPSGCFYGLETLTRLVATCPRDLPQCLIEDWPDFRRRGLLYDVTRGKVPTLDTLKLLVDRLAMWKINQLQLNIEHAFTFSFDPEICRESDGLTPDEVRELDVYCRDRFIELVPALATLGHMGRILSMPKYRHLAEIESDHNWPEMGWPQRMRGLTLDCLNPESHQLIERMCGDMMDAFSASYINGCGDEPRDLGMGSNADRLAGDARGRAYVDHLRRIHDICAARDRRVMFWGDVLKTYPELLHRLPEDVTLLHWGYDDEADYDLTTGFVASGFDTYVCPGTSGWKRILNAMDLAERNIDAFAEAGLRAGATGLLNTDWGDHGHFNMMASSWHGIALGACKAWRADHPTGSDFDRRLSKTLWNIDDDECFALLRQASTLASRVETWRLFWQPLQTVRDALAGITSDEVEAMRAASRRVLQFLARTGGDGPSSHLATPLSPPLVKGEGADANRLGMAGARTTDSHAARSHTTGSHATGFETTNAPTTGGCLTGPSTIPGIDVAELTLACRFLELFADKVEAAHAAVRGCSGVFVPKPAAQWTDELTEATGDFAACWRARNKRSGLDDILRALSMAGEDMIANTTL